MPTIFRINGYRFFFFSQEGFEPPHIHVEKAEGYAKFWLTPVGLASSRGFRGKELAEIACFVKKYRNLFEDKWYEYSDD
ncbi:MAG: DUF4160 domain-containing protein [Magnetococcus sp. YQC-5]